MLLFLRLVSHDRYIGTNLKEGAFSLMVSDCGSKATLKRNEGTSELRSCMKVVVVVLGSPSITAPNGLYGRKATLNSREPLSDRLGLILSRRVLISAPVVPHSAVSPGMGSIIPAIQCSQQAIDAPCVVFTKTRRYTGAFCVLGCSKREESRETSMSCHRELL